MPLTRFHGLDSYSRVALRRLAANWRNSPTRPAVTGFDALSWHGLLQDWVQDRSLPLLVHCPHLGRGREIRHATGRVLIPTDDSPALYLLSLALEGRLPTIAGLQEALQSGRLPIAASLSAPERAAARFTGILESMDAPNLFDLGYSVCHVASVGLRRGRLELRTEVELAAHSLLFLSPVNMFVVPREFASLGGLREFVDEMDDARSFAACAN